MGPWANKKIEKRDLEQTKVRKTGPKKCPPPPVTLCKRWPLGEKAKSDRPPLVVHMIVGEDGTGKGRRTSKGLRINKTVPSLA